MSEWLDTETRELLQIVPPEKGAPPDTLGFTLVLLRRTDDLDRLRYAAAEVSWLAAAFEVAVANRCPVPLTTGLLLEEAMLAQFELVCCDCAAVFIRDEVVAENDRRYLSELYHELSCSEEFQLVGLDLHAVPRDGRGRRYLAQFMGVDEHLWNQLCLPLQLTVMRKKARIMCHWGSQIRADVRLAGR
ncbi:MAG: hypothetical protein MUF48_24300 [Pirellulaceae bacterium]|jgi:hypothetical protein|nr:hypothetical protein [Pirellulaceae bacterium]